MALLLTLDRPAVSSNFSAEVTGSFSSYFECSGTICGVVSQDSDKSLLAVPNGFDDKIALKVFGGGPKMGTEIVDGDPTCTL